MNIESFLNFITEPGHEEHVNDQIVDLLYKGDKSMNEEKLIINALDYIKRQNENNKPIKKTDLISILGLESKTNPKERIDKLIDLQETMTAMKANDTVSRHIQLISNKESLDKALTNMSYFKDCYISFERYKYSSRFTLYDARQGYVMRLLTRFTETLVREHNVSENIFAILLSYKNNENILYRLFADFVALYCFKFNITDLNQLKVDELSMDTAAIVTERLERRLKEAGFDVLYVKVTKALEEVDDYKNEDAEIIRFKNDKKMASLIIDRDMSNIKYSLASHPSIDIDRIIDDFKTKDDLYNQYQVIFFGSFVEKVLDNFPDDELDNRTKRKVIVDFINFYYTYSTVSTYISLFLRNVIDYLLKLKIKKSVKKDKLLLNILDNFIRTFDE